MASVTPIPDGFTSFTPHLTVKDAAGAIDWYVKVFNAREVTRSAVPGTDTIMHAQLRIGDSMLMLNDELPQSGALAPGDDHHGVAVHMYVDDADAVFKRAVDGGAKVVFPLENTFWGDRYGKVIDPFGHHWSIASRIEDLSPEQMEQRAQEFFAKMKGN